MDYEALPLRELRGWLDAHIALEREIEESKR